VSPAQGPIAGGTTVTIAGANLGGAMVKLDRELLAPLSQSDGEIRLQMPAHDNGYVVLSAATAAGTAYARFLYIPPPFAELPPGTITTIAGVGRYKGEFGPAIEAMIDAKNIAFDARGNLYVGEPSYDTVSRIRPDGIIERYAGRGSNNADCCGDGGLAAEAYVGFPRGIAVDAAGNLFIADHTYRIRRVDAVTGLIATIAGDGHLGFSGDGGPAASARIGLPISIAADGNGNVYFTDMQANRIRRIDTAGVITTVAGNGTRGFGGDGGPATEASYAIHDSDTGALAADGNRALFLGDFDNNRIRRIDLQTGLITTFVKWSTSGSDPLNPNSIEAIVVDGNGNVYYGGWSRIVKLDAAGALLKSWGSGQQGWSPDGTPIDQIRFTSMEGLALDAAGNLLYSDSTKVRKLNFATGKVETIAGLFPEMIGEDGPALAAVLRLDIADCAIASSGELLVADGRIRRLTADGRIVTIAGRSRGLTIDPIDNVPAVTAPVYALAIHPMANGEIDAIAFANPVNHIDANGINHVMVGFSDCGYSGDGSVAKNTINALCQPWDLDRDADGNVFIADMNNNRIRRIDAKTGILSTFAGKGPVNGKENRGNGTFCGDGGPAQDACFNSPYSLAFDAGGNLFISDWANARIRRIDAKTGIITTFAEVFNPFNLTFDRWGRLYMNMRDRVVRFDPAGRMTTVAGSGVPGFSGDGGPALQARLETLQQSTGVAVDGDGNLFFVDNANRRVRAVRYGAVLAPPNPTVQAAASGSAIRATVRDGDGQPAPGVRVDFAVPTSGATCALANPFAITDANGVAAVSCTSNCVEGTYSVTARPLTATSSASVTLTNVACRRRPARH
jgi:sugar lactone lactonase YvrE